MADHVVTEKGPDHERRKPWCEFPECAVPNHWPTQAEIDAEAARKAEIARVRTDYGLRIDCAKNGCAEPHGEDGEVLPRGRSLPVTEWVNGHAVSPVERTVTYSTWRPSRPAVSDDLSEVTDR